MVDIPYSVVDRIIRKGGAERVSKSAIQVLQKELEDYFDWLDNNPDTPDNQFLQLTRLLKYELVQIEEKEKEEERELDLMKTFFNEAVKRPNLIKILTNESLSQDQMIQQLFSELSKSPEDAQDLINLISEIGFITSKKKK